MFPTLLTRRAMLRHMGGGFGTLGLLGALAGESSAAGPLSPKPGHRAARVKRVIFLFMNGGPSHVDTFDPKPGLEKYDGKDPPAGSAIPRAKGKLMKSPFTFRKSGRSGVEVSELFPETAKCIDDICVIRSMHHETPAHERALLLMNSGNVQPIRPSLGSWLTYGLGTENQNLPGFVVLCPGKPVVGPQLWSNSFLPAVFQGTHINNAKMDPKTVIRYLQNRRPADEQRQQLDLLKAMNDLHRADRGPDSQLDARIESLEMAYRMQFEALDVFDLSKESARVRDRYGKGEFADACMVARRLVEKGVRMVQIYYGNNQPWDDHKDMNLHRDHAGKSDRPIAALLADLKARGLWDDTLVLWGGEFGRTPTSEGAKGRDHHSRGFTMWLAGGGVKGGHVHGTTDELGVDAVEDRVHVHDLHATILHLMGIDHEKLTFRYSGRDFRLTDVHGTVVKGVLA
ncbi:MAG TPA: DUF1501 domain-containing protein [Gemmataceae bacterium]|nr:DUF1501 domain-containing protein [Gemmataceae bacterium]HVK11932.1 DUF1501 domain-containing protein [Gemmataceae bacterium]